MKKIVLIVLGLIAVFQHNLLAQLTNTGVKLFLDDNSKLYINDKYIHKSGAILNKGEIILSGDWINHSGGVFDLSSSGTVVFAGKRATISGSGNTLFNKIIFRGNGVFNLQSNTYVTSSLDLGDSEIQLTNSELNLENELFRNRGFIYTIGSGIFVRKMQAGNDYLFPLGSSKLGIMRFVTLKPKDAYFMGVAMLDNDATRDGYSTLSKAKNVSAVNDAYYYLLKNVKGNGLVDVGFSTSSVEKYTGLASWYSKAIWDKVTPTSLQDNMALAPAQNKTLLATGLNIPSGLAVPFAFAEISSAGAIELYNAFSPDGDGKNDTWEIKNIDYYPDNDLKVFDRSGNLVYRMSGYNSSKYWDGQRASSGTYIYVLRVKIDGRDQFFKGSITMVKN